VELLGRHSNPDIVSRLQRLLAGQDDDRTSDRSGPIVSRKRRQAQVRLTDEELDTVIAAYHEGLTLKELSSAFGAHATTLAMRMERKGVAWRRRRLTEDQIEQAAGLYGQRWSLARIGDRFGVHPESIRYRLVRAGVKMRDTQGRPKW
jgi:DNA-directed RNA polymerase specialized sigma24 family protein